MKKATNLIWATDGENVTLPNEVVIPEEICEEEIADYLSDNYDFLVESFLVERMNWSIDMIQSLTEKEAKSLALDEEDIKGFTVYFVDFEGYFGYSCLVFKNGHHIYYANDYELHHRHLAPEGLRTYYEEALSSKLFTEEETGLPLEDYDEYKRKEYFLRNYYPMQVDYVSCFHIASDPEESAAFQEKTARMQLNPVAFAYMSDAEFIKHHVALYEKLVAAKEKTVFDYEYQKRAFLTEMYNHEYSINWQADYDTLSAFGNVRGCDTNDLEACFKALEFNDIQRKAYLDARKEYYKSPNM